MGFFDNLGKKASAAYDATAEKTSKIAKEAKFRMKINEDKSEINNIYKEIGKKVYEKHVREENIDIKAELEEECTKLDVLSAEIETCLKSILELKEKKQCEQCHSEIDLDAKSEETSNQDDIKQDENSNNTGDSEQEDSNNMKDSEQGVQENNEGDNTSSENTVEKVTEVMSVETQENAKESANQEQ